MDTLSNGLNENFLSSQAECFYLECRLNSQHSFVRLHRNKRVELLVHPYTLFPFLDLPYLQLFLLQRTNLRETNMVTMDHLVANLLSVKKISVSNKNHLRYILHSVRKVGFFCSVHAFLDEIGLIPVKCRHDFCEMVRSKQVPS